MPLFTSFSDSGRPQNDEEQPERDKERKNASIVKPQPKEGRHIKFRT